MIKTLPSPCTATSAAQLEEDLMAGNVSTASAPSWPSRRGFTPGSATPRRSSRMFFVSGIDAWAVGWGNPPPAASAKGERVDGARDDLSAVSVPDLLDRYAAILAESRDRGVVRTRNTPLGDYAEYLAAKVYGRHFGRSAGGGASEHSAPISARRARLVGRRVKWLAFYRCLTE